MPCSSIYCIKNTGLPSIDDTYEINGTYNGYDYWSGNTNGWVIYFSTGTTSQWCLSDTLGGICTLAGKTPCVSSCPDLSGTYFYSGVCPTPTPTPSVNCTVLDFNAMFDCEVILPTPTPTPTSTPTPTPTPTPTNYCVNVGVDATINRYTPTPTPTSTPTPTPTGIVVRPCNFDAGVIFKTINDQIICPNSIEFLDCYDNSPLYTTNNVINPTPGDFVKNTTFEALVDGVKKCIAYIGVNSSVIGIANITLLSGPYAATLDKDSCKVCKESVPTPTPTPTPTQTPTSTPTPTPTPTPTSYWYKFKSCNTSNLINNSSVYERPVVQSFDLEDFPVDYSYVVQPLSPIEGLELNNVFYDITNDMCWELVDITNYQPTPPLDEANTTTTVNNNFFTEVLNETYVTISNDSEQTACSLCNSANFEYGYTRS